MALLSGIIVIVGLIIGLGAHLYFGNSPQEKLFEEIIEEVVKVETGVDIEDILKIEDTK